MEPDRAYDAQQIRAFCPQAGIERVREIMHELWIHRHVERIGYSSWRRHHSAAPHAPGAAAAGPVAEVKPEDLFDHASFEEFFE
jgi:hypothetical protein